MRFLKRHRRTILVLLVIFTPVLVFRAHQRRPEQANPLERLVRGLTAPIQVGLTRSVGWMSDTWALYVDVVRARQELAEVRIAYGQLRRRIDELELVAAENEALLALLGLQSRTPASDLLAARVIGAGIGSSGRTLLIDRGSRHDVASGMPAVSDDGLVGIVNRVYWTSSEVILLHDQRTTVLVERVQDGARGRLRGDGRSVRLEDVLRADGLADEDRWVTSGLGGVFPPGIPVGSAKGVRLDEDRPMLEAELRPVADLDRLRVLSVLRTVEAPLPLYTPQPLQPPQLWSVERP
jgi:rod shape-determining protein MreC